MLKKITILLTLLVGSIALSPAISLAAVSQSDQTSSSAGYSASQSATNNSGDAVDSAAMPGVNDDETSASSSDDEDSVGLSSDDSTPSNNSR